MVPESWPDCSWTSACLDAQHLIRGVGSPVSRGHANRHSTDELHRTPRTAPCGRDSARVQNRRDFSEGACSIRLNGTNDGKQICSPLRGSHAPHDGTRYRAFFLGEHQSKPRSPPSFAPRAFRRSERSLCSLGDHRRLVPRNGCQNMNREPVGLREIDGGKLDSRLHEVADERDVSSETVQFALGTLARTAFKPT